MPALSGSCGQGEVVWRLPGLRHGSGKVRHLSVRVSPPGYAWGLVTNSGAAEGCTYYRPVMRGEERRVILSRPSPTIYLAVSWIRGKLFLICPRLYQRSEDLGYAGPFAQLGENG